MNLIQGNVIGTGMKVAIVASRFNEFIVNKLLAGAEDGLVRHGVAGEDIDAYWVPGAFELPLLGQKLAPKRKIRRGDLRGRGDPWGYQAITIWCAAKRPRASLRQPCIRGCRCSSA